MSLGARGKQAHDLHNFFNVAWQTAFVGKARRVVMKSKIVLNTTYNTHIKNARIFDHEKKWVEKMLNFCLIVRVYTQNVQ